MTNATQTTQIDLKEYLEYTYPKLSDSDISTYRDSDYAECVDRLVENMKTS